MPYIKIEVNNIEEIHIDVWCGTCVTGLCGHTKVDSRRMSFTVDACPNCMSEKDIIISDLEKEIEKLKIKES